MPTKQPRLNVVLEPRSFRSIEQLAAQDGVSMSLKARELIREALELHEDAFWAEQAHARWKTFDRKTALTHEEVWGTRPKRRR
jgi:hypothetical protein